MTVEERALNIRKTLKRKQEFIQEQLDYLDKVMIQYEQKEISTKILNMILDVLAGVNGGK